MKILVTGGAGFIGSHLVDALIKARHQVTILDNLDPQIHGKKRQKPSYLNKKARFILGDLRESKTVEKALTHQEVIFHQAACVGVGQSMYEIKKYTEVNTLGTANLLQAIVESPQKLKKMIVASSMSLYGEGLYRCSRHGLVSPPVRVTRQLKEKQWEVTCSQCSRLVNPRPTPEAKPLNPQSIYAINKRDHEEMFLVTGQAYQIPTVALRYFNVYGPRQALSNPYTGAVAIFSSALLNKQAPAVFEDGQQSRDLIHVHDIVQANLLVMKKSEANFEAFNVGTGRRLTINKLIKILAKELDYQGPIEIKEKFRSGDIRHCYADIKKIKKLGFQPQIRLEQGVKDLCQWVHKQSSLSKSHQACQELEKRGLTL